LLIKPDNPFLKPSHAEGATPVTAVSVIQHQTVRWKAMRTEPVIVIDPEVMNGTPCFRGTRVPFENLMDYLAGGHSLGEFLAQFPTVTREMAVEALEEDKDSLLARIA
jgi:uncharacterized protein (DUF433 family)